MAPSRYWISREQFEHAVLMRDEVCRLPPVLPICLWLTAWLLLIAEQPMHCESQDEIDTEPAGLPFDSAVLPLEATATEHFVPPHIDIDLT